MSRIGPVHIRVKSEQKKIKFFHHTRVHILSYYFPLPIVLQTGWCCLNDEDENTMALILTQIEISTHVRCHPYAFLSTACTTFSELLMLASHAYECLEHSKYIRISHSTWTKLNTRWHLCGVKAWFDGFRDFFSFFLTFFLVWFWLDWFVVLYVESRWFMYDVISSEKKKKIFPRFIFFAKIRNQIFIHLSCVYLFSSRGFRDCQKKNWNIWFLIHFFVLSQFPFLIRLSTFTASKRLKREESNKKTRVEKNKSWDSFDPPRTTAAATLRREKSEIWAEKTSFNQKNV